jgi:formylglycine-generating enzyme required for sulfatase activity
MARSIGVKVNNMLKDFTQVTGIGNDAVVDKVTSSVSQQVASQTLQGSVQKGSWVSPCNELYVLMALDAAVVQAAVKQQVNSSYKNEKALWQQFQAQKAQDELASAIEKEFSPTPQPVAPVPAVVIPVAQPSTPANMVWVEGGTFTMGDDNLGIGGPKHSVTVSGFYMGKYTVTQKEYKEIMGNNPSNFIGDNLPVEKVSWYDAVEYCNKRSIKEGLTPAYALIGAKETWDKEDGVKLNNGSNGYRLPTEAEWEYAARAGTTTAFSVGEFIKTDQANFADPHGVYRKKTTPVGAFAPNAWGLYDMHGNVWEWCWDRYGFYTTNAQTNPLGVPLTTLRVIRGGSWADPDAQVRSYNRGQNPPAERHHNVGFRVVRPKS